MSSKANAYPKYLSLLMAALFLWSCQSNTVFIEEKGDIIGLASPIQLEPDTTVFITQDYLTFPENLVGIQIPEGLDKVSTDQGFLLIRNGKPLEKLTTLTIETKEGATYDILLKRSEKVPVTIQLEDQGYQEVRVKGEFNGWNVNAGILHKKENNLWEIPFMLAPGKYQYLFELDGKETLDPANPVKADNNIGGFNSVLQVGNDAESAQKPRLLTSAYNENTVHFKASQITSHPVAFWQNQQLKVSKKAETYTINIPSVAKTIKRSFIRIYASNGPEVSNDVLIPLHQGKVLDRPEAIDRTDKFAQTLYFMMVDRFHNGNTANDEPVNDPEIKPQANHKGGDLAGIIEKLKSGYFTDLGINTIWLSPIPQNALGTWGLYPDPLSRFSSYHGYWPISFSKIDYRYGTSEELKTLVEEAHQRDINILLDFVANHVHEEHPVYQQNKDWATDLYLPDGTLNTERWDDHRLTTWFDTFLPTLDLEKIEVTEMLSDSAVFWLKEYNLDGFRHDATKHIPHIFWRTLTAKIKKQVILPEKRDIYQVGETYGSRELISSYINSGELDAQFDFNTYDDAVTTFAKPGASFSRLNNALKESFKYYGHHHLMGNITGNQDRPRFMAYADGSLAFGEDAKYAGWTRKIEVQDPVAYQKLAMLHAFTMTAPGIPVVYYGDEIGMTGAGDPDNRRMMRFENLKTPEEALRKTVSKLTKLRKNSLPLLVGTFIPLKIEEDTYVYARKYFDQIAIVAFNKSSQSKEIILKPDDLTITAPLKSHFQSRWNPHDNGIQITLEPYSFEVMTNDTYK